MKKYKDYLDLIRKVEKEDYSIIKIEIVNEMKYQVNDSFDENEKDLILEKVLNAYLKSSETSLENLVKAAVENRHDLENMSAWDLVELSLYI